METSWIYASLLWNPKDQAHPANSWKISPSPFEKLLKGQIYFGVKFEWVVILLPSCDYSCCQQSWNMVKHVCINVNHSIIWWLTIWKPCHRHDITMEYRSIVRLNETSCRSWYHLITWYHGPTWHHLYMCKHG